MKATVVAVLSLFISVSSTLAVSWDAGSTENSNPATIIVDQDYELTATSAPMGVINLDLNDSGVPSAVAYTDVVRAELYDGVNTPNSYDPLLPTQMSCGTTSGYYIYRCDSSNRKAYDFVGWYDAPNGGNKISGTNPILTSTPITLYAHWEAAEYHLYYDKNTTDPVTGLDDDSKAINYLQPYGLLPVPTRQGYRFLGWFTESNGGTQVTSSTVANVADDVTIYAH